MGGILPIIHAIPASKAVSATQREPELLFNSGFEGTTRLAPATGPHFHGAPEQYEDFVGVDPSKPSPNVWDDIAQHPNLGDLRIYYEGGTAAQRSATIVPDEVDSSNKILRFELREPNVTIDWPSGPEHKARVQAELYGNTALHDFYQTVRVRFGSDMSLLTEFPKQIHWLTLFELWNHPGWIDSAHPFRISISLEKPDKAAGSQLYFAAHGQKQMSAKEYRTLWTAVDNSFPVPFNEWLTLEIYYCEGDQQSGRLYLAVTPDGGARRVVLDVHDYTHHPENPSPIGLTHYNPMKLYTSAELVRFLADRGKVMRVDWDDFALWRSRTP